MALDEAILEHAARLGKPVLRFYGWTTPAATFGYSQRYAEVASWTSLRPLIRRPTGGGLVPHDADWTYSLAFPPVHRWYGFKAIESYRSVHEWIQRAFARIGVHGELAATSQKPAPGQCFVGAERFDLLLGGAKVAGAAQRRTRNGLLIQGSIQPKSGRASREDWEQAMLACNNVKWTTLELDAALLGRMDELTRQKYSQASYNQGR